MKNVISVDTIHIGEDGHIMTEPCNEPGCPFPSDKDELGRILWNAMASAVTASIHYKGIDSSHLTEEHFQEASKAIHSLLISKLPDTPENKAVLAEMFEVQK